MDILIKNTYLISISEKREKIEKNVDILISGDKIKKIGRNIKSTGKEKIIDATNKIVMPGLINTHSHIAMSIFRETVDGYNMQQWLEEKIWPMEEKLMPKDIYYATYLSAIEMVRSGCTTINDMYYMAEESIKAVEEVGVRLQTTRTLMSATDDSEERMEQLKKLVEENKEKDLITINAGIHGLYTTKEEDLKKYLEFAKKEGLRVNMHFCENSQEVEDIKKAYKVKSPVDVIEKYFTEYNTILAHSVKLTDEEIKRLGKYKNISVSHCPVSNLKLGCGIAKIQKMVEENINVSLGTDGQGSGSNLDMFETMKYTALLQKGVNEDAVYMPAYEAMKMATINGAKALGLENEIGSIEENKKADLIIIDMESEQMQPVNDIISDIVYNAKGSNVETTIINGNIVMENRNLKCKEEIFIYNKCKEIINRIKE